LSGFRINYDQVIRQANTISNLSDDLKKEINKLDNILTNVRSNWKGPASQEFQRHLTLLIADMKETKYSMSSVSTTIKNVASRIKKEDEDQVELAKKLAAQTAAASGSKK
jgi:WXG100 family type VII secretion target